MSLAQSEIQNEKDFKILSILEQKPQITQRELSMRLGLSLGGVNYCLRALLEKGIIKINNFSSHPQKTSYRYILTPKGIKEKSIITRKFLERKMKEYDALKVEIEGIKSQNKLNGSGRPLK